MREGQHCHLEFTEMLKTNKNVTFLALAQFFVSLRQVIRGSYECLLHSKSFCIETACLFFVYPEKTDNLSELFFFKSLFILITTQNTFRLYKHTFTSANKKVEACLST